MTEYEADVIEAAMEVSDWTRALDCGAPAQKNLKRAQQLLIEACTSLASEGDGTWVRRG